MKKAVGIIITCLLTIFIAYPTSSSAQQFPDVDPYTPLGTAVEKLMKLEIVAGFTDGTYRPNDVVTRAQAARIMYGILELEQFANETYTARFKDLSTKHWAYKEIMTMADWGYLNGFPDGSFKPDVPLTRGQMALILKETLNLSTGSVTLPFKDVKKGAFYYDGVAALYHNEITFGKSTTIYAPEDSVTRGELALFLDRSKVLDTLLNADQQVVIFDFEQLNGKSISESEFQKIYTKHKHEIWSVDTFDVLSEAYYDDETITFEGLSEGDTFFDIYLKNAETPIFLKVSVSEDGQKSLTIKTPTYMKKLAKEQQGALSLQSKINSIMAAAEITNMDYIPFYFSANTSGTNTYVNYLGEGLYYIEFTSFDPIFIEYDFISEPILGELVLIPYRTNKGFDYVLEQ